MAGLVTRVERGDGWELRLCDCVADACGLASIESVDHIITDPPYAKIIYQSFRTNAGGGIRTNGRAYSNKGTLKTAAEMAAERIGTIDDILVECAGHFARIAKRWIATWSDLDSAARWKSALVDAGAVWRRTDVWTKTDPMPQISADRPAQGCEFYTLAHAKGRSRWNGGGRSGSYIGGTCKGNDRPDHPSPKPLWLMEAQVRDLTDPDETVLDPFTGSGTTGVACIRLGRRFIGMERDPAYFEIALKRLRAAREQRQLFAESDT